VAATIEQGLLIAHVTRAAPPRSSILLHPLPPFSLINDAEMIEFHAESTTRNFRILSEPKPGLTDCPSARLRLSSLVFVGGWKLAPHVINCIETAVAPVMAQQGLAHAQGAADITVAFGICAALVILS